MSKRSQAISSLFMAPPALSADNKPTETPRRVSAGTVRSLQNTFSDVEKENAELRERLDAGEVIVEVDPGDIAPSPFRDRFEDADEAAFEALKSSIAERGQEIPVLLRPDPARPGKYQTAYGHRRVRAGTELNRPVRAVIRALSDADLAIAQGVENAAREDLTFIERAVFALRLEDAGQERAIIQQALTIDRAEVSKLISVGRGIPAEIVSAIGRAPKVGRPRWLALVGKLEDAAARKRATKVIAEPHFKSKPSDARFTVVLSAAELLDGDQSASKPTRRVLKDGAVEFARVAASANRTVFTIEHAASGAQFAAFVESKFPVLFAEFAAGNSE